MRKDYVEINDDLFAIRLPGDLGLPIKRHLAKENNIL